MIKFWAKKQTFIANITENEVYRNLSNKNKKFLLIYDYVNFRIFFASKM